MLWTSLGMQMWTFECSKIPPSISNKRATPLLREFGAPTANFQGSCDFDAHFFDHQMIFNTDFCGSNAGETFEMHGCPMVEGRKSWESCNVYVASRPEAFKESYWEVNYLDVYEVVGAVGAPQAGPPPSPPSKILTSYAGAAWPASWATPAPFPFKRP